MAEEHPEQRGGDRAQPPPDAQRRPRVHILLTFVGAFLALLVVFHSVLFPFLMAIYIAYLVEPIVQRVTRSRLLGLKWTRGPTIVTLYVLVLGGLSVLGWVGITKLAKTVRETSHSVTDGLKEAGQRATFTLDPPPAPEAGSEDDGKPAAAEKAILVPKDTRLTIDGHPWTTLYRIRLSPEERALSVLLQYRGEGDPPPPPEEGGQDVRLADIMGLSYANGEDITLADAQRVTLRGGESATGLEYALERRFISPIVGNLEEAGFEIEPTLLRDFVHLKGETLQEVLPEQITKGAVSLAGKLVLSVYEFFLILMLTAFIVMDRRPIARFFASLPPPKHQAAYLKLIKYVDDGLAGVIRGQLVICGVNGVLTWIGLMILGVPYALLLASVAAVLSLIPVFGTIVSSIPIVLVAATDGLDTAIFALLWILFIHALEGNVLNPTIMGSHARMHPVIIIFALLAGEHAFGIWGALLAVPTMSIIQSCFRFYLHEVEGLPGQDEGGGRHGLIAPAWSWLKGRLGRGRASGADGAAS